MDFANGILDLVKNGSNGAVVLLLVALVYLHKQNEKRQDDLMAKLENERALRLADAKSNSVALLEMQDRVHTTIEDLDRLNESLKRTDHRRLSD